MAGTNLPIIQMQTYSSQQFSQFQTTWASAINPSLSSPLNNSLNFKDISLIVGTNVINHMLGRVQQGWFLTDITVPSGIFVVPSIFRNAEFNNLTLSIYSSAPCTINLGVF